jgi:hypothetical protein
VHSYNPSFYIDVQEKTTLDTGTVTQWQIVSNTSLFSHTSSNQLVLISPPPNAPVTDAAPPILGYTLAVANGLPQIFMHFSEPIFHRPGGTAPTFSDFSFVVPFPPSGVTITGPLTNVGGNDYTLGLSGPLTPDDLAQPARITVTLQDGATIAIAQAATGHRVSDLILGVSPNSIMEPMFAHDETQSGPFPGGIGLISLGGFDGSKWLRNKQTIALEGRLPGGGPPTGLTAPPGAGTTSLIYDIDVPASLRNSGSATGVWLPPFMDDVMTLPAVGYGFSGLVATGNSGDPSVRSLSEYPSPTAGPLRDYQIPSTEPKDHDGAVLDFLFKMTFSGTPPGQTILGARVGSPLAANWYTTVTPWTFALRDIRSQRGGVQILNNVINPDKGQVTTLQFTQGSAGNVTVTVFDLSGSIIRVLVRQNQAAGDYGITWDGTNRSGAKVTRGLYFIKVIGPGIDEIRKVLVVR